MKTKPDSTVEKFKAFVRQPYAWPGGYPLYAITADGEAICKACGKKYAKLIISETRQNCKTGWQIVGVDVNSEDSSLTCDNCNDPIESAYGDEEVDE